MQPEIFVTDYITSNYKSCFKSEDGTIYVSPQTVHDKFKTWGHATGRVPRETIESHCIDFIFAAYKDEPDHTFRVIKLEDFEFYAT